MKIAILASEGAPYATSGGLGDVVGSFSKALAQDSKNEISVFLPYYSRIRENYGNKVKYLLHFEIPLGWRKLYAGIFHIRHRNGLHYYFIDNEYYFRRTSDSLYGESDDGERFAFFSKACLGCLKAIHLLPDIIHCNDWQTGTVPYFLKHDYRDTFPNTKCIFTVHNAAYQGWANDFFFDDVLGNSAEYKAAYTHHGCFNSMKGALLLADYVTTVSETYAKEILQPQYAYGLESIFQSVQNKLSGIINGIDTVRMNPRTDSALAVHYHSKNFEHGKKAAKAALQSEFGLKLSPDTPLLVMICRLVSMKGLDLFPKFLKQLLWSHDVQLIIVGSGEKAYETYFRDIADEFPEQVGFRIAFDPALSSRVYAGGDFFLMPSFSEPCGTAQLNAMRYGTVPIVHGTGGLLDTVTPFNKNDASGLGFVFMSYDPDSFQKTIESAVTLFQNCQNDFHKIQLHGMQRESGWAIPCEQYLRIYQELINTVS